VPRLALAAQALLPLGELLALRLPRGALAVPQLAPLGPLLLPDLLQLAEAALQLLDALERAGALLVRVLAGAPLEQQLGERLLQRVLGLGEPGLQRRGGVHGLGRLGAAAVGEGLELPQVEQVLRLAGLALTLGVAQPGGLLLGAGAGLLERGLQRRALLVVALALLVEGLGRALQPRAGVEQVGEHALLAAVHAAAQLGDLGLQGGAALAEHLERLLLGVEGLAPGGLALALLALEQADGLPGDLGAGDGAGRGREGGRDVGAGAEPRPQPLDLAAQVFGRHGTHVASIRPRPRFSMSDLLRVG
jgi:hypothetical protein